MFSLGIDIGSAYFKAVLLDSDNKILYTQYKKYSSSPLDEIKRLLEKIEIFVRDDNFYFGITSLNSNQFKNLKNFYVNEVTASTSGVLLFHPEAKGIIEIGGESSKFIVIKQSDRFVIDELIVNNYCAAGTGSFIEQQAHRLGMSPEELSAASQRAQKGARIAGRCSVFAKSDMIHLQQKGIPVEEIAYGLCLAIARNSINILLSGRDVLPPIVIAGGCAKNSGIVRAFSELLKLKPEKEIVPSKMAGLEACTGSAIEARKKEMTCLNEVNELINQINKNTGKVMTFLRKLNEPNHNYINEPSTTYHTHEEGYLGIDVGSVSTNIVFLNRDGKVLSALYLPTAGNPVKACTEGLQTLKNRFPAGITILGCGTTGSGRYLAGKLIGADIIKNEITCQALGTTFYFPEADTIFEIGGQDSKYISLENGEIVDFVMNKICAAGTGSFIEEQAGLLGISVYKEFSQLAFSSQNPPGFSANCTVYMESELSHELKNGIQRTDACAGLAYAIARNYLEKVVEKRKIGKFIVFQGGVASNRAVLSAFQNILGMEIHVHPYNRVSGAIGAALSAMRAHIRESNFKGFQITIEEKPRTFECKACSNYCEVTEIHLKNEKAYFGDVCEKFTSKGLKKITEEIPDLSEEYISECEKLFANPVNNKKIGIPRASFFLAYLPFFWKFFNELGYSPVLSSSTSEKTLLDGLKYLPAPTCLPARIAVGHIADLILKDIEHLFFPSIASERETQKNTGTAVCPFTLSIPYMINIKNKKLLTPQFSFGFTDNRFFDEMADKINEKTSKIRKAFNKAKWFQLEFEKKFKIRANTLLSEKSSLLKFVVIGRPYSIFDTYINMNLFAHLKKMNVFAIPYNFLNFDEESDDFSVPWKFPGEIIRAIKYVSKKNDLYPVIISNYGCGLDGITQKIIEETIRGRPYLMLEFDEHRGEAGLITRLEAFVDVVERRKNKDKIAKTFTINIPVIPERNELKKCKIYVPYFADHAHALSGALKFAGYDAELLPEPDNDTKILGSSNSDGKECHAYAMLLGDLIKLSKNNLHEKSIYLFTGTTIPCLLNQFQNAMNLTLDEKTREHIQVITPETQGFFKLIKMSGCTKMYEGLLAIEILLRIRCALKPYETKSGLTESIYKNSLKEIEKSVSEGDVLKGLKKSIENFGDVKIIRNEEKPKIGIAGDIYTRINSFANENLFSFLEEKGFEVMPAPFEIDIIDWGIEKSFFEAKDKKDIIKLIPSSFLYIRKSLLRKKFISKTTRKLSVHKNIFYEPDCRTAIKFAEPYFRNISNELILLNIAKVKDFIRKGAKGVINAMCLNCMVGISSQAIIEKVKKDTGIPVITLVYSERHSPAQKLLLETFCEQVLNS